MNKIYLLSKALNDIGLHKESGYIDSLIKVSNLSGIKTLGLKDSAAKTFVESFGEKWAFVIAKWVIESSVGNKSFENYYEVFFIENAATLCKALNACDQLLKTPVDKREIKVIALGYADGSKVLNTLNNIKSNIGKIVYDERANALIIVDMPDIVRQMEKK
jgi:type II secretory pathway component GspD/PulD (secretin)